MSEVVHLAARLTGEQARAAVDVPDWPGTLIGTPSGAAAELVWIPFDRQSGRRGLDRSDHPRLAKLSLSADAAVKPIVDGAPPADAGVVHAPAELDGVLYAPFWLIESPELGWAAVDAVAGHAVAGEVNARWGAAVARLALLLTFSLLSMFIGGALLVQALAIPASILGSSFGMGADAYNVTGAVLVVLLLGLLLWRMRANRFLQLALSMILQLPSLLPSALREPTERVALRRVELPLDRSWLGLLKTLGALLLITVPLQAIPLAAAPLGPWPLALRAATIALTAAAAIFALVLSRGTWLPASSTERSAATDDAVAATATTTAVWACLDVGLWALVGVIVASTVSVVDMASSGGTPSLGDPTRVLTMGAEAGALLGAVTTRWSRGMRLPLVVGMITELAAETLLGPWTRMPIVLLAVGLAALPAAFRLRESSPKRGVLRRALALSWAFNLGAVLGRLVGPWIGLVALGPAGLAVGAVLGDRLGAVTGLLLLERVPAKRVAAS